MAKVEKKIKRRERVVVDEEPVYLLELSEIEAKTLVAMCTYVFGDRHTTYRKYTQNIFDLLSLEFPDWYEQSVNMFEGSLRAKRISND